MSDLKTLYDATWPRLKHYNESEAKEITFLVFEHIWAISKTDLLIGKNVEQNAELSELVERLNNHEPIQYVLGGAWFLGRLFSVNSNVLIPRPETEELVNFAKESKAKSILDLGTGSGAIAISLALELKDSEVFAVDISERALETAKVNAKNLKAKVNFEIADILDFKNPFQRQRFELIISNPPYITNREKSEMRTNVLDFEPHLALFVSNERALVYYEAIAKIGLTQLEEDGLIWVEINSYLGNETAEVFRNLGYTKVEIIKDFFGKDRFLKIQKKDI